MKTIKLYNEQTQPEDNKTMAFWIDFEKSVGAEFCICKRTFRLVTAFIMDGWNEHPLTTTSVPNSVTVRCDWTQILNF